MDVGMKIRAARKAKGLSLEELGKILGVQKSAVAKYENGRITNIGLTKLKKISEVLEIPPHELIYEDEQNKKPIKDDGLSNNQKLLIEFAKSVPDDKAAMVLRVMKSILEVD